MGGAGSGDSLTLFGHPRLFTHFPFGEEAFALPRVRKRAKRQALSQGEREEDIPAFER